MKKAIAATLMIISTVAIAGKMQQSTDNFTNTTRVWFTNNNHQDGRLIIQESGIAGRVWVRFFPVGGFAACGHDFPILVKDTNGVIHSIPAHTSQNTLQCSGLAPASIFQGNFMMRVPHGLKRHVDITVNAKEFDAKILKN